MGADGGLPRRHRRLLWRRLHVLQPDLQSGQGLRLRVPARRSGSCLARVPERARRHLSETRPRCAGPELSAAVLRSFRSTVLRTGTPVASTTRSRSSIRCLPRHSCGCSAPTAFWSFTPLLMTLCYACAYAFLVARSDPIPAMLFAGVFLVASVVPVYMVWLTPDFFNLALVLFGYFFWAYKEVSSTRRRCRRSALARAVAPGPPLGPGRGRPARNRDLFKAYAHFSRRPDARAIVAASAPVAADADRRGAVLRRSSAGLFAWNVAITGDWNYQGGDRKDVLRHLRRLPVSERSRHLRHRGRSTRDGSRADRSADLSRCVCPRPSEQPRVLLLGPPPRLRCRTSSREFVAMALFAMARGRRRHVAVADAGGWAWLGAVPPSLHAVHLLRRRRADRQSLLSGGLSGLPVPGPATRLGGELRSWPRHWGALHGQPDVQSVLRVSPSRRTSEGDPLSLAARRDDARQRSAGQRHAVQVATAAGGNPPMLAYFLDDNAYRARERCVLGAR